LRINRRGAENAEKPRILLAWFSRQGTTTVLAQAISRRLRDRVTVDETLIRPRRDRGYWSWLALSFLPGSRVAIEPAVTSVEGYELIVLGFPKWTFSCPPVNQYLSLLRAGQGDRFALFMSFGGFDQERFLGRMALRLRKRGCEVTAAVAVKRRLVEGNRYQQVLEPFFRRLEQVLEIKRERG
jgi:hypothetical protein